MNLKQNKKLVFGILIVMVGTITTLFVFQGGDFSKIATSKTYGTINIASLGSPILGSPYAYFTIIEFGNYQCSDCKKWNQNTKPEIIANIIEKEIANLVFVDVLLSESNSLLVSTASYCANEQTNYWDYHDMLFNLQESEINAAKLKQVALEIGLDVTLFEKCLDSGKYEKKIKYSTYEAKKNGIKRLPTFIIVDNAGNYEKISNVQPYSVFEEKINLMK